MKNYTILPYIGVGSMETESPGGQNHLCVESVRVGRKGKNILNIGAYF